MDMTQIIRQMFILFLIMGTGYLCGRLGYMDEKFSKQLSNLVLTITTPAMVLASVTTGKIDYPKSAAIEVLLGAVVTFAVLIPLSFVIVKLMRIPQGDVKLYMFMVIFSNTGYMGYPVLRTIYGEGAIFLASIFNMVFGVVAYSLGVWLMSGGEGKFSVRTMINPSLICSVIALFIFLFDLRIPAVLSGALDSVGSITSPCAMMLIGSSLSLIPVKDIFTEIRLYPFSLIKQIAVPFIMHALLGLFMKNEELLGIVTVLVAMPVASMCVMFANQYGGNAKLASKGVFITTVCSFVTIPILCYFL
ncbi:MAG: AEC family transporter [Oscillospiraceae bacterium]|nr:AEC family transporter [Oscillospiraceae bacterium]